MKRPHDAIVWWELRRVLFNLALLIAGLMSVVSVVFIGSQFLPVGEDVVEPLAMLFGGIAYGILANIFYTLSWVTEIAWSGGNTSRTEALRPKIFRWGMIFSVILTLAPGVLIPLIVAIQG